MQEISFADFGRALWGIQNPVHVANKLRAPPPLFFRAQTIPLEPYSTSALASATRYADGSKPYDLMAGCRGQALGGSHACNLILLLLPLLSFDFADSKENSGELLEHIFFVRRFVSFVRERLHARNISVTTSVRILIESSSVNILKRKSFSTSEKKTCRFA